jgi:hypothetical protein
MNLPAESSGDCSDAGDLKSSKFQNPSSREISNSKNGWARVLKRVEIGAWTLRFGAFSDVGVLCSLSSHFRPKPPFVFRNFTDKRFGTTKIFTVSD